MYDKRQFYFFGDIEKLRNELLQNTALLLDENLGAGSKKVDVSQQKINAIAKTASISEKYGQLLSRIVDHFQCTNILELGTCLGLGTAYLASANSKAKVVTIEGSTARAEIAKKTFEQLKLKNIALIAGNFSECLPVALNKLNIIDLAFIDGNHRYEPTISYFNQLLAHINNDSILIFDDIHWSEEMQKAWKEICAHPQVTVTIDLFRLGIVFFRKEQAKENFILYF